MSDEITAKTTISCINGDFEVYLGKSSHRIDQADAGIWTQSGVLTAGVTLSVFGFDSGGVCSIANISPDDTYKDVYMAITSDLNKFMTIKPGEEWAFRTHGTTIVYRVGPEGSGSDPIYEFNLLRP